MENHSGVNTIIGMRMTIDICRSLTIPDYDYAQQSLHKAKEAIVYVLHIIF